MTTESKTTVTVKGIQLEVPTYKDPAATQEIADTVTRTIQAIEDASERIDTQRFAVEACMKLATDAAQTRDEAQHATDQLGIQLASVNKTIENLIKHLESS